ncbi:MAG TPA: hypothetical protein ENK89_04485 [Desulfobulbaceae bacterium]|nr:hypothetical protein [Desulfobulbaceae bacterium]
MSPGSMLYRVKPLGFSITLQPMGDEMKRIAVFAFVFLLATVAAVSASSVVNFIDSARFMKYLEEKKPLYMVDIQRKNDYLRHHFYGALPTNAYPVRSGRDKDRLKTILAEIRKTKNPIIIIGPRGSHAAKRAYAFLQQQGIAPERLAVLKKGIRGWPEPESLLNTYGQ